MPIRFTTPNFGETFPQFTCDVCGEPMARLAEGNATWEAPPVGWHWRRPWTTEQVWFTHKKCDRYFRHWASEQDIHTWWEELSMFPIHLMYNAGMQSEAKAALDARQSKRARPEVVGHSGLALRFAILKRDGYRCQICGVSAAEGARLEVDHKIARVRGGSDHPTNLWTLCFECNRGKRDSEL